MKPTLILALFLLRSSMKVALCHHFITVTLCPESLAYFVALYLENASLTCVSQ